MGQTTIEQKRRASTRWSIFFTYISTLLNIVQGVLLVPLYVHFIPTALYGAWLATGNVLVWVSLVDPGYSEVVQQRVGHHYGAGNRQLVGEYAGIGLLLSACLGLAVTLVGMALLPLLGWITDLPGAPLAELHGAFILALLGTALTVASYGVMSINLGLLGNFGLYGLSVLTSVGSIVAILWGLENQLGVFSLGLGVLVRGLGLMLAGLGYLFWRWRLEKLALIWSHQRLRDVLGLTGVFFIGKVASQLAENVEAVLLARFLGTAQVPVYVLTQRCIGVMRTLAGRHSNAIMPTLSSLHGAGHYDQARRLVVRLCYATSWILGVILAGFLALNGQFVSLWVGAKFYAGTTVNTLFCVSAGFVLMSTVFRNLLIALGFIRQFSMVITAQSVLAIGLMLVGGWYWGMAGMASATIIAVALTGFWLGPRFVLRHLQAGARDYRDILCEAGLAIVCGLLTAWVISRLPAEGGWVGFAGRALLDGALYVGLLALASARFRRVVCRVLAEGKLRMAVTR